MQYFLDTVETIPEGLGFNSFGAFHIAWLIAMVVITIICCKTYKACNEERRKKYRKIFASLIVLNEIFKQVCLIIGGNFIYKYLPLQLCSLNIFFIAIHAWKPSKLFDNFLYAVAIPTSVASMLFPTWVTLPFFNFSVIHSFTVHIELFVYPVMLFYAGDIKPDIKVLPKALLLLCALAVPIYGVNLLCDTNFMFLMYAPDGNPLKFFENVFGNHLIGFPVLAAAMELVMYGPLYIYRAIKKKKAN